MSIFSVRCSCSLQSSIAAAPRKTRRSQRGIADYKSLDGKPVHIIVLIVAPEGEHETYIRLLAQAADVFRHEDLRQTMIQTGDPEASFKLLTGENA